MVPDHLQSGVDEGHVVRVAVRRPAQVKQNQSAAARCHLQELGQGGDGLVLDAGALRLAQRGARTERVPLGPGRRGRRGEKEGKEERKKELFRLASPKLITTAFNSVLKVFLQH